MESVDHISSMMEPGANLEQPSVELKLNEAQKLSLEALKMCHESLVRITALEEAVGTNKPNQNKVEPIDKTTQESFTCKRSRNQILN